LSPPVIEKVRNIVTFLQEMEDARELRDIPGWKAHQLAGNRKGTWSLTVTRNWRITTMDGEKTMVRMARPAHPGRFIRMEVIEPLGLSVTGGAKILGVTRPACRRPATSPRREKRTSR